MKAASIAVVGCLFLPTTARADQDGRAVDVTPDLGIFFSQTSDQVAMLGPNGILSSSGRGGLHRSLDGGRTWTRAMSGAFDPATGVEPFMNGVCASSSTSAVAYAMAIGVLGSPDGLYRSDDFGATWHSGSIGGDNFAIDCAVSPFDPQVVYVQAFSVTLGAVTVLKSTDGGATWSPTNIPDLQIGAYVRTSPVERNTVYVGDHGPPPVIYVSHDGGATFTTLEGGGSIRSFYFFPSPSNANTFLAAADEGLYRSDDAGDTFKLVLPGGFLFAFDPADPRVGYAVGGGRLHRTSDGGKTFAPMPGPAAAQLGPNGVLSVAVAPSGDSQTRLYVSTDRGPYRSDDGGNTFRSIADGYRGAAVNDLAIDATGRLMVAANYTLVVFRAATPGRPDSGSYSGFGANVTTSQPDQIGEWDGTSIATTSTDPNVAVVSTVVNGVFSTTDGLRPATHGGADWTKAQFSPRDPHAGGFVRVRFAPGSATRVYHIVGGGFGLSRSDDGGKNFTRLFPESLGGLAIDPTNPDAIYLGSMFSGAGLFKSTDGGTTTTNFISGADFASISIDRHTRAIYAGNRAGGVLRSNDDGATWSDVSSGLPAGAEVLAVEADPNIANRAYAWVQGKGLFSTANAGTSWKLEDSGESLRRSGLLAGRAAMAVDPVKRGRVYLGNSGVVQIDTLDVN
jgi:hypothetical protein